MSSFRWTPWPWIWRAHISIIYTYIPGMDLYLFFSSTHLLFIFYLVFFYIRRRVLILTHGVLYTRHTACRRTYLVYYKYIGTRPFYYYYYYYRDHHTITIYLHFIHFSFHRGNRYMSYHIIHVEELSLEFCRVEKILKTYSKYNSVCVTKAGKHYKCIYLQLSSFYYTYFIVLSNYNLTI